jgi:tRNA nucleotidyltransferase/poly(A) polymerase
MAQKVSYTGVFLDKDSRAVLEKEFKSQVPDGWEWIAHHMTITLGEMVDKSELGKQVALNVVSFGKDDKVMAIGVKGYPSKNEKPHITLAVNRAEGGKPYMSNLIKEWVPYSIGAILTGVVSEYPPQSKETLNEAYGIKSLPFYNDVINKNGKIYQVGGAVRDLYLGKQSKDLDIVISGIPAKELEDVLKKYGKVDMVGASFGVIKFTPPDGEEIDIAIPRTEKKSGVGYQGFDVSADHTLPIEKDLERRDFTINSIAKDSDGNVIDPFGGLKDLDSKVIKLTNPKAFSDDPLRMLRAIQFASRFGFKIDEETFDAIKKNAMTIDEISKERILIEFDKIVNKGNPRVGAELLVSSGLYRGIFGTEFDGDFEPFDQVTRNSEFAYWLIQSFTEQPDQYYKNIMKGDIDTAREISALAYMYNNLPGNDKAKQRFVYFNINKISPQMFNSNFVRSILSDVINDFDSQKYPAGYSDLKVNGNDLMAMGLKGKAVGDMLNKLISAIYSDKIENTKNGLLGFVERNKDMLNESVGGTNKNRVVFYDFDGTLMDSPLPDTGKQIYKEKTGNVYPHQGWWGRAESLDLNVFDIKTNPDVEAKFRADSSDPNTHVVLLTNRLSKLEEPIKKVLDKHNMVFDFYSFKNDGREKGERVLDILAKVYPNTNEIEFYDDDERHIQNVRDNLIDTDYDFKVNQVIDGRL